MQQFGLCLYRLRFGLGREETAEGQIVDPKGRGVPGQLQPVVTGDPDDGILSQAIAGGAWIGVIPAQVYAIGANLLGQG